MIIYQSELAKMAGLSERSTAKLIEYCRREGIKFKRDWSGRRIYTLEKWVHDSAVRDQEVIDFG